MYYINTHFDMLTLFYPVNCEYNIALTMSRNESLLQQYQREGRIQSFQYLSTPLHPTDNGDTHQVVITVTLYENTTFECTGKGPSEQSAKLKAEEKLIQVIQTRETSAGERSLGNGTSDSKLQPPYSYTYSLQQIVI